MDREKIIDGLKTIVRPEEASGRFDLMGALEYLDTLSKNREIELNAQFRHFLANRSYEKALVWLMNPEAVEHKHS